MLTRMVVLGLLLRRPMTGYEIQQLLQLSQTDQWADILPGSIYHALKKMAAEGLVRVQSTEQTGFRTKAIFAITPEGEAEYRRLLREAWRTPSAAVPKVLYTALSLLDDLPRSEVLAAIDQQIAALEARLADWTAGEAAKDRAMGGLPDHMRAAFANAREHMEADLRLLRHLRQLLPDMPQAPLTPPPAGEEEAR